MNHLLLPDTGEPDWPTIEQFDWVPPMQACPQDPIWHAEGDVWTHTKMVIEALLGLDFYKNLAPQQQYVLFLSALLHDVAKPRCTQTDPNGRIVSPKHAKIGEQVARQLLWDADFELREQVCSIVRLHGLPLWALYKRNSNRRVLGASLRISNAYLVAFATADILGRICEDEADMLERIGFYEALCEEQQCLETAYNFHNDHSKFQFFYKNQQHPASIYDDTTFEVTILSGIAGSGKDTYAHQFDQPIISLDAIRKELNISFSDKKGQGRVAQEAYDQAKKFAAKKTSFIWNSTNLTASMRMRIIHTLAPYRPKFKIVYLETSWKELFQRRKETIPRKRMETMLRILEVPMPSEAHEVVYVRT